MKTPRAPLERGILDRWDAPQPSGYCPPFQGARAMVRRRTRLHAPYCSSLALRVIRVAVHQTECSVLRALRRYLRTRQGTWRLRLRGN